MALQPYGEEQRRKDYYNLLRLLVNFGEKITKKIIDSAERKKDKQLLPLLRELEKNGFVEKKEEGDSSSYGEEGREGLNFKKASFCSFCSFFFYLFSLLFYFSFFIFKFSPFSSPLLSHKKKINKQNFLFHL